MKVKINEAPVEKKRPILFSELSYGELFRYWEKGKGYYCLKIVPFDIDEEEYNCINLDDGEWYLLNPNYPVEKYDGLLELREDCFVKEK